VNSVEQLDLAVGVLSAMVIPVIMISACGSLTISTGNRLGRAIDRTRKVSELAADSCRQEQTPPEELRMLSYQLQRGQERTRMLHAALSGLYASQAFFVATSVGLALGALLRSQSSWWAVVPGLLGALLLLRAIVLLILETRISGAAIRAEMDFIVEANRALQD
jgi:hypothetical protein